MVKQCLETSLARVITFLAGFIRGRDYYGKYEKMYRLDLKNVPSLRFISSLTCDKVLDVGCGIGYLSSLFKDYVGVDINREALIIAKKNTYGNYVIASARNLPLRSGTFDCCVSYDFIEHVKELERRKILAEMKRVSMRVIMSCVDFSTYYRLFTYDETHQGLPIPEELAALLEEYFINVRLIKTSGLFVVPRSVNMFLSKYFPNQVVLEAHDRLLPTY